MTRICDLEVPLVSHAFVIVSSVIGPNGAGKSTIVDGMMFSWTEDLFLVSFTALIYLAICFVLGGTASSLRGNS